MFLYIIRHGQSSNNALGDSRRNRVCDPTLTELGFRQAELVGAHLCSGVNRDPGKPFDLEAAGARNPRGHGITALYASPMLRALQTAELIGSIGGLTPCVHMDIHEVGGIYLDHGEPRGIVGYPGLTRGEVRARFPGFELADGLGENGWWNKGLESRKDAFLRASRVAGSLRDRSAGTERIAMVTHAGFSNLLVGALLGLPYDESDPFHFSNTGVSLIRFRADGEVSLRYVNRVEFLPPELVT